MFEFEKWPKTKRLGSDLLVVVTEKIDGTNAQVHISDDGTELKAGSRTRYITPEDDNAGFATWCEENKEELLKLGPGRHYGEWYGEKIQRTYGLDHKRFALFNTQRWLFDRPSCCDCVPVLYNGPYFSHQHLLDIFYEMKEEVGSYAVPGWDRPEGLWIYFPELGAARKMPLDK